MIPSLQLLMQARTGLVCRCFETLYCMSISCGLRRRKAIQSPACCWLFDRGCTKQSPPCHLSIRRIQMPRCVANDLKKDSVTARSKTIFRTRHWPCLAAAEQRAPAGHHAPTATCRAFALATICPESSGACVVPKTCGCAWQCPPWLLHGLDKPKKKYQFDWPCEPDCQCS